jgi:CDP-glucose 4,6-dehydratase
MSVIKLVEKILVLMDSDLSIDIQNHATNEIQEQWLSSEKASKILNWKPSHSLDMGLKKTIKWYEELLK